MNFQSTTTLVLVETEATRVQKMATDPHPMMRRRTMEPQVYKELQQTLTQWWEGLRRHKCTKNCNRPSSNDEKGYGDKSVQKTATDPHPMRTMEPQVYKELQQTLIQWGLWSHKYTKNCNRPSSNEDYGATSIQRTATDPHPMMRKLGYGATSMQWWQAWPNTSIIGIVVGALWVNMCVGASLTAYVEFSYTCWYLIGCSCGVHLPMACVGVGM